jgi:hypothetical protein
MGRQLGVFAQDERVGMTLDELASFVQLAMREDMPGTAVLRVQLGWGQQVKWLKVEEK